VFTAVSDFVLIVAASIIAGFLYHMVVFDRGGNIQAFFAIGIYSALIFVLLTKSLGLYQPKAILSASTQLRGLLLGWGVVLLFVTSLFFVMKTGASYSRGATMAFGFLGFALVLSARGATRYGLRKALDGGTLASQSVLVIGDPEELAVSSSRDLLTRYGRLEVGRFALSNAKGDGASNIEEDTLVVNAAIKAAQTASVDQILLALGWNDVPRRIAICERLRVLPLPVFLLPDRFVSAILSQRSWDLSAPAAVEIQRAPLAQNELVAKRTVDLILAGLGLACLLPLLTLISVAIKLDSPGPIIFRQRRRGFNGREFTIYKFRTMTVLEEGDTIRQAQRADKRVTRVGRFLRATSMDELTQLINVLFGDMSLVGPRPHAVVHDKEYCAVVANYAFRQHVKPGITGWAQIHGFRGETAELDLMKQRIDLDLWYIKNWSFWLDLRILLRTCVELTRYNDVY
jgi:undecaprenyl-phosphate galactose phosphotransferase/putative colanic acid biosynthesis UDP-glucose lipid carrier transferase